VEYGDRLGHCWSGDHTEPLEMQRLTVYQRFLPQLAEHIARAALDDVPDAASKESEEVNRQEARAEGFWEWETDRISQQSGNTVHVCSSYAIAREQGGERTREG
jgi:hypothetical protein